MADELDRRAQILEAAFEEFSAKGFKGATIKSIARAAGLQSCARHPLPHRWLRTLAGARKGDALPQVNGGGRRLARGRPSGRDQESLRGGLPDHGPRAAPASRRGFRTAPLECCGCGRRRPLRCGGSACESASTVNAFICGCSPEKVEYESVEQRLRRS